MVDFGGRSNEEGDEGKSSGVIGTQAPITQA